MDDRLQVVPLSPAVLAAEEPARAGATPSDEMSELPDLTHDSVVVTDLDGAVTFWNAAAERTYGWTSHEAVGQLCRRLLRTELPESFEAIRDAVCRQGRWEGELVHLTRQGRRVIVGSRWALRRTQSGRASALVEVGRDVTAAKQAEEALAAAETLRRSAAPLVDVVNQILDLAEVELAMITEPGAREAGTRDIERPSAGRHGDIALARPGEQGDHGHSIDREAIAQIRRVDPDRFVHLVEVLSTDADAKLAALRLASGAGDGPEVSYLARSLRGSIASIGARRLAELCTELEACVGDWETARWVVEGIEEELRATKAALAAEIGTGRRPAVPALAPILVVEDDPVVAAVIQHHLEIVGLANPVTVATDADQAMAWLSAAAVDPYGRGAALVVLDEVVDGCSVLDLLRWLRGRPGLGSTPVLMLTAEPDPARMSQAYALGAWSYLVKPVALEALGDVVRDLELRWALLAPED